MKKITILALHLGTGGVENSIASLSNMLSEKYDVEIISTYKLAESPAFYINDKVKIKYLLEDLKPNKIELKKAIKSFNIIKMIKEGIISLKVLYYRKSELKKVIKNLNSDIVISTRDFHNEILGKYGSKKSIKIAQEHNYHNNNEKYINKIIKSAKNIDYFMPVSQELTDFYAQKLKDTNIKCIYIPHALDNYPKEVSKLDSKNIISVGRLSYEKGFDDLIDVFEILHKKHSDWKLNIVGDGDQTELIKEKIREKKLEECIKMHGFLNKQELEKIYLNSSIYAMTSRSESFGLVLIEAESYGIPIVCMDSAKGALEIIENKVNGEIVENRDKEKMADIISKFIEDDNLKNKYAQNGRTMSEKYKKENVSKLWFEFIEKI